MTSGLIKIETAMPHTPSFDTIVIGLGAMGSASLLQLAHRGQRVLGIDRYDPPHSLGSTHGETRITRCAIGEGEAYVPLVLRSHEIWRELEAETGLDLLTQSGALIMAGADTTAVVHGKPNFVGATIAAARRYNIAHDILDADAVMRRFPQFRLRGDERAYFEPGGGFVRPENCVAAQLMLARRAGATIRTETQVTAIDKDGAGVRVTTADGTRFFAAEAVLAAGAWSPGLSGATLSPRMAATRQVLHWFEADDPNAFAADRCPVFIWTHGDAAEEGFYGFPIPHGGAGVKVAMEQYHAAVPDPDHIKREIDPAEPATMFADHVAGRLAGIRPIPLKSAVCLYTMTPDGDFLVARAPENDRVLLVSACSGHGFKHSAGLGEAVAQTIVDRATPALLRPFSADRFSQTPTDRLAIFAA